MKNGSIAIDIAVELFARNILSEVEDFAHRLEIPFGELSKGVGSLLSNVGQRAEDSMRLFPLPGKTAKKNKSKRSKVAVGSKSRENRTRSKISSDNNRKVWANYTPRQKKARLKKMYDARIASQRKKAA